MNIKIEIAGITPLICNRFYDEVAEKASGGHSTAQAVCNHGTPLEQAEKKLYLNAADIPIIPQPNLLRCLIDGGRFFKAAKKQITTKTESMLYSCLDIETAEIPIIHRQPWKVDTRPIRIPSTGGRILAHRPMFDDWALSFECALDDTLLSVKLLREIIDAAGKRIGLGDYRPACKGPYGKFVVTQWTEKNH